MRDCDKCARCGRDGCKSWDCDFVPRKEAIEAWKEKYETADRKTEPTISKMEQVDKDINVRSKDKPQICDTCRYYNSNIPCGSTPSACKEADKFAEEFVDGLKKLKPKDEPQTEREGE